MEVESELITEFKKLISEDVAVPVWYVYIYIAVYMDVIL